MLGRNIAFGTAHTVDREIRHVFGISIQQSEVAVRNRQHQCAFDFEFQRFMIAFDAELHDSDLVKEHPNKRGISTLELVEPSYFSGRRRLRQNAIQKTKQNLSTTYIFDELSKGTRF